MPRNKYPGQCIRCGRLVKPGEGHFERVGAVQRRKYGKAVQGLAWITQHADCAIEHRGTSDSFLRNAPSDAPQRLVEKVDSPKYLAPRRTYGKFPWEQD